MEFFIDNENIEKQFQKLFKKILNIRNGEAYSEMNKYGLNYKNALGVSIVNLKEIAKQYEKNHLLAQKLWAKGFRESRIVASLLEKPEDTSKQQVKRWIEEAESNELLEQMCMNLFVALPELDTTLISWIKSEEAKEQLCATMVIGRLALIDKERGDVSFENFLNSMPSHLTHFYLIKQMPRVLGKIARRKSSLKDLVFSNVAELKRTDDKWLEVFEELHAEFPDVN
ncbi:DNA alkylation repair protein [Ancylomarina sp. 16SWW S1-10-2]|uniref:DNA alkylation repair protein n=1 Tax=Ancylomarina sp. 16SWW S1-10-2 TaxID=2499681 RepID=UPI0012ADB8D4|nr:DNA alkylation repair protein [Ancylomarina sp. 16SWW S1-10-2]MRT91541.1 hypothetical protein [Ancylomarina sp. 16SWW S1-10-2]